MKGNVACIGLGFGDEGKGMVTNWLCQQARNPVVIRFSGGHQCAHTVYGEPETLIEGKFHIFANFGSGTLSGVPTYWTKYCTFEPTGFVREHSILKSKGVEPVIFIDGQSPVTTPYDISNNQKSVAMKHGSTGVGFGSTLKRHRLGVRLTFSDIIDGIGNTVFQLKMKMIRNYYKRSSNKLEMGIFLKCVDALQSMQEVKMRVALPPHSSTNVYEGSQGVLLDQNHGFFPHVTPSNTTIQNIVDSGIELDSMYLVTRAYQTRHGNGPMTNAEWHLDLVSNRSETNKTNKNQGKFRTSVLDLDLLRYAARKSSAGGNVKKHLVVTCTDHIDGEYKLTMGNKLKLFADSSRLAKYIAENIGIDGHVYINDSPLSSTMRRINEM